MRYLVCTTITALVLVACGGGQTATPSAVGAQAEATSGAAPPAATSPAATSPTASEGEPSQGSEFVLRKSDATQDAQGLTPSKIKPTKSEAALKFVVVDKDKGPIPGIVIALTAPDGMKFYTEETNAEGYAEVLVPVGQKYELVYLALGRRDIAATVSVSDEPNQNIRLTLRYKRYAPPAKAAPGSPAEPAVAPGVVLHGVTFDSGKAAIRAESFPQLDGVIEYMTHKKAARIAISGHTDNVGNPKTNKALSTKRAQACRDYMISKGIEGSRIEAIGYGDERPIGSNDTEEGRQQNRRIEAAEL